MSEGIERELGKISATLEAIQNVQESQGVKLDKMDERLRGVEVKSAGFALVASAVVSTTLSFITGGFHK